MRSKLRNREDDVKKNVMFISDALGTVIVMDKFMGRTKDSTAFTVYREDDSCRTEIRIILSPYNVRKMCNWLIGGNRLEDSDTEGDSDDEEQTED